MRKLSTTSRHDVAPEVGGTPPGVTVAGGRSVRRLSPDGFSLWLCLVDLDEGARISWEAPARAAGGEGAGGAPAHSDQALHVLSGALEVTGATVVPGGALVVESEAAATATATAPTQVVHVGAWSTEVPGDGPFGPPAGPRHRVHVVGPDGWFTTSPRPEVRATWFADGTCEGCRLALFRVNRVGAGAPRGRPHTHSQDEIIYVLGGAVRLGAVTCPPGTALCVPGDVRYAETSGPEGSVFLNFRRDASTQVYFEGGAATDPRLEAALALGGTEVGDLVTVGTGGAP